MSIRKILVPLTGRRDEDAVLESGFAMARRFEAHVTALHLGLDPRDAIPFVGDGFNATAIEAIIEATTEEAKLRAGRSKALYDKTAARLKMPTLQQAERRGHSTEYLEATGAAADLVAQYGRLSDLIVVSRRRNAEDIEADFVLEPALRETGRPALIVSSAVPESLGQRIIFAWNGSIEATHAIAAAMPFLGQAQKVVVLAIDEGGPPPSAPAAVVDYLSWYGAKAEAAVVAAEKRSAGQVLCDAARDHAADLVVLGAYTRNRMSRLIFGGVTGELLNESQLPLLMMH